MDKYSFAELRTEETKKEINVYQISNLKTTPKQGRFELIEFLYCVQEAHCKKFRKCHCEIFKEVICSIHSKKLSWGFHLSYKKYFYHTF